MTRSRLLPLCVAMWSSPWLTSCSVELPAEESGSGGSPGQGSGGSGSGGPGSGGGSGSGSGGSGGGPGTGTGGSPGSGGMQTTGSGGGAVASGGSPGSGGKTTSGSGGTTGTGGRGAGGAAGTGGDRSKFSFFVTSVGAMQRLSKSANGFGGDLRYGQATGLAGADKICTEIAETSMVGSGAKGWRAFLSTTKGGDNDGPVNAIDRIGPGPWYDRLGRTVALTKADLMETRPKGADQAIVNDLPNEDGIPNHLDGAPGCTGNACPDNHDILTGTNKTGGVYSTDWSVTCHDWTSAIGKDGKPRCGHSWPRGVQSWMSILDEAGCAPGINLIETGPPNPNNPTVGSGGGYGGIYCFALSP